jgi:hypothetical protein
MKRAFEIVMFLSFLWLAFVPGNASGQVSSPCTDMEPPFITTGAKPNILIILDNSGSMADTFQSGGSGVTKISAAKSTLISVIQTLGAKANFGLMTFTQSGSPQGAAQGNLNIGVGDVNPADPGNQYSAIISQINSVTPNGITPTPGVFQAALNYFNSAATPIQFKCQKNFIVLITDGLPNTNFKYVQESPDGREDIMNQAVFGIEELYGTQQNSTVLTATDSSSSTTYYANPDPTTATKDRVNTSYYITTFSTWGFTWTNVSHTFGDGSKNNDISIPTYCLGVGGSVNHELDLMAKAGGTAINGQAILASDATAFIQAMQNIMASIIANVAAGSSVSTIATTSQDGDNMLQGVFYPEKSFGGTGISWPGYLYDWWYTIQQPTTSTMLTSIREDNNGNLPYLLPSVGGTSGPAYTAPDYFLDLQNDYILYYNFNPSSSANPLSIDLFQDTSGNGTSVKSVGYTNGYQLDALTPLWEAGKLLWKTAPASRTIYTPDSTDSGYNPSITGSTGLVSFDTTDTTLTSTSSSPLGNPTTNASSFDACLSPTQPASSATPLNNLINYVRGLDFPNTYCSNGTTLQSPLTRCSSSNPCTSTTYNQCAAQPTSCRNRTVGLCTDNSGNNITNIGCVTTADCTTAGLTGSSSCVTGLCADSSGKYTSPATPCTTNSSCGSGSCISTTWKLGDIVYSTPKVKVNYSYCYDTNTHQFNNSTTTCTQNSDCTAGCTSGDTCTCSPGQDLVFVGANDGMLHAFQSGALTTSGTGITTTTIAKLTSASSAPMGSELWAFVPTNSLPYLRCLAPLNTCHLYYNDLTPYITTMTVDNDYCATGSSGSYSFTSTPCDQDSACAGGQVCVSKGQQTKIVLIGGMRLGGGASGYYCTNADHVSSGWACNSTDEPCPTGTKSVPNYYCNNGSQTNSVKCVNTANCSSYSSYPNCGPATGQCQNSGGTTNGYVCSGTSDCSSYNYGTCTGKKCVNSAGKSNGKSCTSNSNCATYVYTTCAKLAPTTAVNGYCVDSTGATGWQTCSSKTDCTTAYAGTFTSDCLPFSTCSFISNIPSDTCSSSSLASLSSSTNDGTATSYTPPSSQNCTGLSSYYALDITNPNSPKLLWEYSNPLMGFSYSGPAVIHKWLNPTTMTGNQYDVMFLSGPTNPYNGSSALPLRAFVLKLNPITLKIDSVTQALTNQQVDNASGGRLFTTGFSVGTDTYTDYVAFGYTSSNSTQTSWGGGVGLVYTGATNPPVGSTSTITPVVDGDKGRNPAYWTYDVKTFSNVPQAPITAQVANESCFGKTYLFAGSGKYFYGTDQDIPSGNSNVNFLTALPFTCDNLFTATSCQAHTLAAVSTSSGNACTSADTAGVQSSSVLNNGWIYSLPDADTTNNWLKERMITDPTTYPTAGLVFFTSSQPTSDPCSYGGRSEEWAFNCATGGPITDTSCGAGYTATSLLADLYLQTSTGAVYSISNSKSGSSGNQPLTFSNNGGRSSQYVVGTPPESSLPLSTAPATGGGSGVGQMILWIER